MQKYIKLYYLEGIKVYSFNKNDDTREPTATFVWICGRLWQLHPPRVEYSSDIIKYFDEPMLPPLNGSLNKVVTTIFT